MGKRGPFVHGFDRSVPPAAARDRRETAVTAKSTFSFALISLAYRYSPPKPLDLVCYFQSGGLAHRDSFQQFFFLARKRCTYGGTELSLGPSTPSRLAEQCYGVGREISGSNP